MRSMIKKSTWAEFRQAGMLWWVNRALHLFGWALVVEMNDDGETIRAAYPARCKYRGFTEDAEERGFETVTAYMTKEGPRLLQEMLEERIAAAAEKEEAEKKEAEGEDAA